MNKTQQTLVFVLLLGLFASVLLLGMNLITAQRIEQNEAALLQAAILNGFDVEYSFATINETFETEVDVLEYDGLTFYYAPASGRVSFHFEGGGVWGPILGIVTLESDWTTIAEITILEHEETPGLGGVLAEREYLNTFVGKQMEIDVVKGATSLNNSQVDAITGATRTSDAFETLLNTDYVEHKAVWEANQE